MQQVSTAEDAQSNTRPLSNISVQSDLQAALACIDTLEEQVNTLTKRIHDMQGTLDILSA